MKKNEAGSAEDVKEIVETYNAKHGDRIKETLTGAFNQMVEEMDGDSLALFHLQLGDMILIVQESAKRGEMYQTTGAMQ